MQNNVVKYSITVLLLIVYINRGIFVTPYEVENKRGGEINSVIEWIHQLATGECNGIDEDGDSQTFWNFTNIFTCDFQQQSSQIDLFSKEIKKSGFPNKENFLSSDFYFQIDHPPEIT